VQWTVVVGKCTAQWACRAGYRLGSAPLSSSYWFI